ncbi:MAG: vWA domain-containing protein [Myxococcota bacterium]
MGSVGLASVCRVASAARLGGLGAAGLSLAFALGCSASSNTGNRASGGTGTNNGSGGSNTSAQGGASDGNGGSSMSSNGGSSNANGGSGTGGSSSAQGGASSGGTSSANGGSSTGSGGATASGGMTGAAGACQMAKYNFEPKIPTVYVMVDRSGSMFDCISTTTQVEPSCATPEDTAWVKLRTAAESVMQTLQGQVRFGFASFTGTNPTAGGMCPMLDEVAPALNNYEAIKKVYDGLPFQPNTTEVGKKFETPARQALDTIGGKLIADTAPGDKYILFVTDGQPDYCDDANTLCAPDSVIAGLQNLKAKNVTTIVMGLQSAVPDLPAGILQSFANAGAGQPTLAPLRANSDAFAFYDQCNGVAGWRADLVASGKTAERGVTLGTYVTTGGGTAKLYAPSNADQAMIASQLGSALAGVKSCTFDLSNVGGQSIKVDLNNLAAASVAIEGKMVPQDGTSGWSMASASQLVLNGTACETWRSPNNNKIDFNFPCDAIIFE